MAAALEAQSEHPLAAAVLAFAAERIGVVSPMPSPRLRGKRSAGEDDSIMLGPSDRQPLVHNVQRVDWIRPVKDLTIEAGEDPFCPRSRCSEMGDLYFPTLLDICKVTFDSP